MKADFIWSLQSAMPYECTSGILDLLGYVELATTILRNLATKVMESVDLLNFFAAKPWALSVFNAIDFVY